jgi:hypothetical protein
MLKFIPEIGLLHGQQRKTIPAQLGDAKLTRVTSESEPLRLATMEATLKPSSIKGEAGSVHWQQERELIITQSLLKL